MGKAGLPLADILWDVSRSQRLRGKSKTFHELTAWSRVWIAVARPCGGGARLLRRACTRRRRQAVLLAGAAARPDRADDLAVDHNRNAALGRHRFFRKGHERAIARGVLIRERFARTTEQHGGARLALGDLDRRQLRAVHLLEIDE